ncbi:imidazole glycerol phosphate synthase subunit HisH [Chloroflexota bacterium]
MIAIIDYGAGNLRSVSNAIAKLGYKSEVTSDTDDVLSADAIILPGVGAAADTMHNLKELGMAEVIRQLIAEVRPLLAICVGMQVLFQKTEEGGWKECLGIIPGYVRRLPQGLKVPHMGWNQVKQMVKHPIFEGIPEESNFYFVHSYYADPDDKAMIAGVSEYGVSICSMLIKDNLIATQFHPERSGEYGLRIYDNFLKMALDGRQA